MAKIRDTGCIKCDQLETPIICLEHLIEATDAELARAMRKLEELKEEIKKEKEKQNELNSQAITNRTD